MALVSYSIMLRGNKGTIRREANTYWEPGVKSWGLASDIK